MSQDQAAASKMPVVPTTLSALKELRQEEFATLMGDPAGARAIGRLLAGKPPIDMSRLNDIAYVRDELTPDDLASVWPEFLAANDGRAPTDGGSL